MKALYIEPGSPGENGYSESFDGKLRDDRLNGEIVHALKGAKILIENKRQHSRRSQRWIRAIRTKRFKPPEL